MCICFNRKFKVTKADPPSRKYRVAEGTTPIGSRSRSSRRGTTLPSTLGPPSLDDFHHLLSSADINPPIGSEGTILTLLGTSYAATSDHQGTIKGSKSGGTRYLAEFFRGQCACSPWEVFYASPFPVIITLEDHLKPDLQEKVPQMLTQTFGDILYYPQAELKEFPSPEELKYPIVISAKPPKEYLEAKSGRQDTSLSHKDKDSDEDVWGKEPTSSTSQKEADKVDGETNENNDNDAEESDECESEICLLGGPVYKNLIAIHAGRQKGGLKEVLKVEIDKVRRLSLSKQELKKAAESYSTEIVRCIWICF